MKKTLDSQTFTDFRQGKEHAFKLVFLLYQPRLVSYAYRLIKDRQIGEDIINDAFVELFINCAHFNDERHLESSLYMRVRHRCFNYLNQMRRPGHLMVELDEDIEGSSLQASSDIIMTEVIEALHVAIESLPAECKKIFKMLVFEEMTPKEIAKKLNKSVQSIYTQRSIARSMLRLKFKEGFFFITLVLRFIRLFLVFLAITTHLKKIF